LAIVSVNELLEAGVHFGHRASRWNPKMAPYIFGKRRSIHIIDLKETIRGYIRAYKFLTKICVRGEEVLFVGTKRQAKAAIKEEAQRAAMHYVCDRWLGGTLTNFQTIRSRLRHLEHLETLESGDSEQKLTKKELARIRREKRRMLRNLEGIRRMEKIPGALVIIDPKREHIAVKEATKMGVPTICLLDTDCDPDLVDIVVPGNDDAMRSIQIFVRKMADAVLQGRKAYLEAVEESVREKEKAAEARRATKGATQKDRGAATKETPSGASDEAVKEAVSAAAAEEKQPAEETRKSGEEDS